MARAQEGDRLAYCRLLQSITPALRRLVMRHDYQRAEVEDTIQDILLTIHAVRHTYDPARPFGPWLVAIARRRVIDRLRQRGRRGARETELTAFHETFLADETNEGLSGEERRTLRAAIATLPRGQRQAIEMLKLRELSLKEAAQESGLSVAALKVSTHRALKALRLLLMEKLVP
ncbi:MAG TPA: sigma-70 family RNA polymerase sigma factor [Stellaceae bacterium]|nr:sigma-70 family RNA polymerase sigma factor [Stellaceae bacterium]